VMPIVKCILCNETEKTDDMMICYYCGRTICLEHSMQIIGVDFYGKPANAPGDNYFYVYFCEDCYTKTKLHNKIWQMLYENSPNKNEWEGMKTQGCIYCKKNPAKIEMMDEGHEAKFCKECYSKFEVEQKIRELVENSRPTEYESIHQSYWRD